MISILLTYKDNLCRYCVGIQAIIKTTYYKNHIVHLGEHKLHQ